MSITLDSAALGHGLGAPVPPLSLTVAPGAPVVIAVETDERPLLVSVLLAGRIPPDSGRVLLDDRPDSDALRRSTALVDTPWVAEPAPGIPLAVVVAEELSFAGRPASRRAVRTLLDGHGLGDYARLPVRALPPTARVELFSELALLRAGVRTLIVTSPERHGGNPADWFDALAAIAQRGTAVAIVTDAATRDILLPLGARDALAPAAATPLES
ncbi:hypothetical protein [Galbitalea soli]|uniref:ABC transporter ATP-binding protein n=1 Tax=Galbitalea soli TaxID=1268042 RepID=A0A7C9TRA7_9MICO|nr:hypothetical protein [Galbitalea soli]NEM91898.1 hypothetical protein [Galbitalea soli]NYJ29265.1 hypothetical protein [Galbitalea soli]